MKCVIFETYGTDGDVLPFVRIGKQLSEKGNYKIGIVTHSYYKKIVEDAGLDFIPEDTLSEYAQFINDNASMSQSPQGHIEFIKRHILPHVVPTYEKIKEYYIPNETIMLNKSPGFLSTLIGEKLNIPRITVFLSPSFVMNEEFVVMFYKLLKDDIAKIRGELGLKGSYDWKKWWKSAKRYVAFWPEWFEVNKSQGDKLNNNLNIEKIGFFVDTKKEGNLPDEVNKLIEGGKKPLLINSSSSSLFITPEFFEACLNACEELDQEVILVGRHKEFIPTNLSKRVHFFDHLEFDLLMPHVKAIIHHGGIGTSAQSLYGGLPQLVLAGGVDRPDNARCLENLGVAKYLLPPKWKKEYVEKALKEVLTSETIKDNATKVAEKMRSEDPVSRIKDMIDSVFNECEFEDEVSYKEIEEEENTTDQNSEKDRDIYELIENLTELQRETLAYLLNKQNNNSYEEHPIEVQPRKEGINCFPQSYVQEEFWFADKNSPEKSAFNVPSAYVIEGKLNVKALEDAFNEIFKRHENLRTVFGEKDGQTVQYVHPYKKVELPFIDLRDIDKNEQEDKVEELLLSKTFEDMDLSKGPLMKLLLVQLDENKYVIWWAMHHIIHDAWALEVLNTEIRQLYSYYAFNKKPSLPEIKVQCADFSVWQKKVLKDSLPDKINYWKNKLKGYDYKVTLPETYKRPEVKTSKGSGENFTISEALEADMKAMCRDKGISLFMLLMSALNLLLYVYTKKLDIVISSPISERNREELEDLICDFSNTLAYRTILNKEDSIIDVLEKFKDTAVGAYENQEVSSHIVEREMNIEHDNRYSSQYQIMFILQQIFPSSGEQLIEGAKTKYFKVVKGSIQMDTCIYMFDDVEKGLYGVFDYNIALYSREAVLDFIKSFKNILQVIVKEPNLKISELESRIKDEVL